MQLKFDTEADILSIEN